MEKLAICTVLNKNCVYGKILTETLTKEDPALIQVLAFVSNSV